MNNCIYYDYQLPTNNRTGFSPQPFGWGFFVKKVCVFGYKGHLTFGIIATATLKALFPEAVGTYEVVYILFGSLLPDVDHQHSKLGRYNPLAKLMTHRGHCHSLIGSILLCVPFFVFGGLLPFGYVLLGAVVHLLSDKLYSWFPKKRPFAIRIW